MLKPEKVVQKEIQKYVKENGGYVIKVIKGNESGIHDLIICLDGLFVSCEVKAEQFEADPFKAASEWQKRHYTLVRNAKGIAMIVASLEQFKEALSQSGIILK